MWKVDFYSSRVKDDILDWPNGMRAKFLWITELIEEKGPNNVRMPYVKPFVDRTFEIRASGREGEGRAPFCIRDKSIMILSGFIKKTQKTPQREIELVRRRLKEVMRHG